ncbi:hypothetical protein JW906_10740, partial [bacterium]|nr:hypothetical protein [bacterium]
MLFLKILQKKPALFCFLLVANAVSSSSLFAQIQWGAGQFGVSTASSINPAAVPDGQGGQFLAYVHNPAGDLDIYAQHIDGSGTVQWGSSGIAVNADVFDQKNPALAADGTGGIYVAWTDAGTNKIMAQHLNASGTKQWGVSGIQVCTATGDQSLVQAASDGFGGVIWIWQDKRNTHVDLYAQCMNSAGNLLWGGQGKPVVSWAGNQTAHQVLGDGKGGIYAVWQDTRNGNTDINIYAQKLNANGDPAWSAGGAPVVTNTGNQQAPSLDTLSGRIFVAWHDNRAGNTDIYAQALKTDGTALWTANGVPVST